MQGHRRDLTQRHITGYKVGTKQHHCLEVNSYARTSAAPYTKAHHWLIRADREAASTIRLEVNKPESTRAAIDVWQLIV